MAKQPKFLIAKNQLADPEGIYVYHTQKPRLLFKLINNEFVILDDIDDCVAFYGNSQIKVEKLMKRLEEWYIHNGKKV